MRAAKNEARDARVSGGASGICASTYACRVLGGIGVTSERRASGVGGKTGFEGMVVVAVEVEFATVLSPFLLNAASEGDGVRSCFGSTEPTAIAEYPIHLQQLAAACGRMVGH